MKQDQLSKITRVLRDDPRGMTVTQISKEISLNRNSVAKYLEVLLISGHVEMRSYGPAKVFFLSQRVPISAMLDFSSDYIVILDRALKIIQINDNFLKLADIERKAILGQRIEDVSLPVFNTPEMVPNLKAALNGKEIAREMKCLVGEIEYCFNIKLIPTTFEDGLPGVTMILENITERKKAEEAKNKLLQVYGERVKELSCLYGISKLVEKPRVSLEEIIRGIVNLLSPAWQYPDIVCARIVFEEQEFKTKNFKETRWKQQAEIKVDGKRAGTVEVYYLEEKPTFDEGPFLKEERNLIEAVAERLGKIIERKSAEEERVRLFDAVKMSIDSIVITDVDARIIDVNEATLKLYGADDKRDLVGKCFFDLVASEDREKVLAVLKEALEKGYRKILHFEVVTKDGARKTVEMSLAVMKDADGGSMGLVGVSRDISERKKTK